MEVEREKIMNQEQELKALTTINNELNKIYNKYKTKAEKERAKVNDVYITIQGEKCYTEEEINAWIEADYISATQANKYIEKLEARQKKAGQEGALTKSECVCKMLENTIANYRMEIKDIEYKVEQELKRQERWKIAQAQGCSYSEWMDLEEISKQSEEYEQRVKGFL